MPTPRTHPSPGPSASTCGLGRPLDGEPALFDTTLDQLRTLVVHETGTALGAARVLGREQSSVQKQLGTMNRNFGELCGEPLVRKQGRGVNVFVHRDRKGAGGSREPHAGDLAGRDARMPAEARANPDRRDHPVHPRLSEMVHVRTRNLLEKHASRQVDLVCGSVLDTEGRIGSTTTTSRSGGAAVWCW